MLHSIFVSQKMLHSVTVWMDSKGVHHGRHEDFRALGRGIRVMASPLSFGPPYDYRSTKFYLPITKRVVYFNSKFLIPWIVTNAARKSKALPPPREKFAGGSRGMR